MGDGGYSAAFRLQTFGRGQAVVPKREMHCQSGQNQEPVEPTEHSARFSDAARHNLECPGRVRGLFFEG